jgi:hypothetical protein
MKPTLVFLCGLALAVGCVACSGYTTPATNVTTTSATLNAMGGCAGGSPNPCSWYWRYGTGGQYQFTTPVQGPCGPGCDTGGTTAPLNQAVTGLTPYTQYRYQICGKGDNSDTFGCVGPDGTGSTSQAFTTGTKFTYGYDSNGRLNSGP